MPLGFVHREVCAEFVNLGYNPVRMPEILLITIVLAPDTVVSFDRSVLRWDFANIVAAAVLLSVAVTALGLFFFRRRARDLTLVYFGLFSFLYSVRLLATLASFQAIVYDAPYFWAYLNWCITAVIVIPLNVMSAGEWPVRQVGLKHKKHPHQISHGKNPKFPV